MRFAIVGARIAKTSINDFCASLAVEARSTDTFKVSVWKRSAAGSVLTRFSVTKIAFGQDGGVHVRGGALEHVAGAGEQQLVLHEGGGRALGDPRLDVVRLDPLRQPSHVAVAVEWIGSQSSEKQGN